MSNRAEELSDGTQPEPKQVKPRGDCTGCKFDYQLGTARKGEYKGQLVIRKHLSRTGPGECLGSQKPPKGVEQDQTADVCACGGQEPGCPNGCGSIQFVDPAPVLPPQFPAMFDGMGTCGHEVMAGEMVRSSPDEPGGVLCGLCSDEGPAPDRPQHVYDNGNGGVYVHEGLLQSCAQPECQAPRATDQLPHDRTPETVNVPGAPVASVQEILNGHDVTDTSGNVYRHGGSLAECTTPNCVQYRNRLNPPDASTPVQHQCDHGLYADVRNCPQHGVPTTVKKLPVAVAPGGVPVFGVAPGADPAGQLNGVPVGHTHHSGTELHQGRKDECTLSGCTTQAGRVFVEPAPVNGAPDVCTQPGCGPEYCPGGQACRGELLRNADSSAFVALAAPEVSSVGTFADPAPAPADLPSVSGQPEPDRDQWGRYKIQGAGYTRATTFAKLGSSTYALSEWNERMLIKGLVLRPDLLAMAHSLDVKRDKGTLNKIADDAQEYAGNKVAANIGTAYHTFTERLDAGLMTLDDVPAQWRTRCRQYLDALALHGLTTRPEWMERTTAVRADQVSAPVGVAGTLDRIFQEPDGTLVIGDLKTSSNIEYSWSEIAVQLALYAHGVNTHGLFDWNTKTWQTTDRISQTDVPLKVRTDYAIVMHLPADGDGCVLYKVDLVKGWEFAQVSGLVQARQKAKNVAVEMVPPPRPAPVPQTVPAPVPVAAEGPAPREDFARALELVRGTSDPARLMPLHQYAVDSGLFTGPELVQIQGACADRWAELNVPY